MLKALKNNFEFDLFLKVVTTISAVSIYIYLMVRNDEVMKVLLLAQFVVSIVVFMLFIITFKDLCVLKRKIIEYKEKETNLIYRYDGLTIDYIKLRNERNELLEKISRNIPEQSHIPEQILMRMISLCHPDKHNNSERSNDVTKFLLNIKNKRS